MKLWIQILHKRKQLIEINERSSMEEAHETVCKVFDIPRLDDDLPFFVLSGHILTGPHPFVSVKPNSQLIFYTEKRPPPPRNPLDLDWQIEEEEIIEEQTEEEEDELSLFSREDVQANLDNSVLPNALQNFVNNMQLDQVVDENNSIFNNPDELARIGQILTNNSSNFVPFVEHHLTHPSICSRTEEEVFDNMCSILDVESHNDIEDDEYALVDQMTARQRASVDKLCARGFAFSDVVDALQKTNFNIEEATNLLGSFNDID